MNALRTTNPGRSRLAHLAVLATAVLGLLAGSAGLASAAPPPKVTPDGGTSFGFTVRPYAQPGSQPRAALEYEVEAGQTITDRVAVVNGTDKPMRFYLYAADAYNTSGSGGYALRLRTEKVSDAGGWVTLPAPQVTIPGHNAALVPLQITVPRDAEPGDHAAGIVAEEVVARPKANSPGAGVSYVHRVATRVYIRVAGPVHPRLQVSKIDIHHTQPLLQPITGHGGATITYTIRNSGNVRLTIKQVKLQVNGLFGRSLKTVVTDKRKKGSGLADDLLPGNSIDFRAKMTSLPPLGMVTAKVTAKAEDPVIHKPLTVSRSSSFLIIPWLWILLIIIVTVLIVLGRRRRRRRAAAAAAAAGAAGTAGSDADAGSDTGSGSGEATGGEVPTDE